MVRKIYLPREVFPLSSVLSAVVDFGVSMVILLGLLLVYGYFPSVTWTAFPVLLVVLLLYAVAAALFVSALTVYIRDTRFGMPMVLQILLFLLPVAYPLTKALDALPPHAHAGDSRTLGQCVLHGWHDEANHQGEMYLLFKMQKLNPAPK